MDLEEYNKVCDSIYEILEDCFTGDLIDMIHEAICDKIKDDFSINFDED